MTKCTTWRYYKTTCAHCRTTSVWLNYEKTDLVNWWVCWSSNHSATRVKFKAQPTVWKQSSTLRITRNWKPVRHVISSRIRDFYLQVGSFSYAFGMAAAVRCSSPLCSKQNQHILCSSVRSSFVTAARSVNHHPCFSPKSTCGLWAACHGLAEGLEGTRFT